MAVNDRKTRLIARRLRDVLRVVESGDVAVDAVASLPSPSQLEGRVREVLEAGTDDKLEFGK